MPHSKIKKDGKNNYLTRRLREMHIFNKKYPAESLNRCCGHEKFLIPRIS